MNNLNEVKIKSLNELKDLLSYLLEKINKHEVVQIQNYDDLFLTKIKIEDILKQETVPDFIRYYFKDLSTSIVYILSVETYHGVGGELKRI